MECPRCHIKKLSEEYPPTTITDECDHPVLICLKCTINHMKQNRSCPEMGCNQKIFPEDSRLKLFEAILSEMFTEYTASYTPEVSISGLRTLYVTMLTGESINIPYNPYISVLQLKEEIYNKLKHDISKQKLLYQGGSDDQGIELQIYKDNGEVATLSDYGVKPNSTIHLVVVLYDIPQAFDQVVFDLFWGYPSTGMDFLDASCLLFSGVSFIDVCDYRCSGQLNSSVSHSGDVMNDAQRIGHHTIHVSLKKVPPNITHMYFTLSAWNSPNISRYPKPSLRFHEASNPSKNLCNTTFTHANHSQAVIMCSVSKGKDGSWRIFESGKLSAGNAKNYEPLKSTIRSLINQGY
ncbi:hypothetical protein CHS0354_020843 [Potamilus streckersoni]|uniref:Ubiquitin-like domain-containing protein n=1 Tax=Potamilus streckersoni TaxID=2493646 RepID=A0AAE0VK91_9BIVA|nr:hypothetical protein CHS0354_020843 [Potamilus streckersoni]